MGLLSNLYGKPDSLRQQADRLVTTSRTRAISTFVPLLDRYSVLRDVDVEHWDFIVTVAGVLITATRLNNFGLEPSREEDLMKIVSSRLEEWDRDGIRAFEDCKNLFDQEYDRLAETDYEGAFLASDALGI